MAIVAIVGAGFMGTATAWPLTDNGHTVRLVGTHLDGEIIRSCKEKGYHPKLQRELPAGVHPYFVEETSEALDGAEIVVSGVNSSGVLKTLLEKKLISTAGKKPVVVPRRKAFGEHVNDHQLELARELESLGRVYVVYDLACLPDAIQQAREQGAAQPRMSTNSGVGVLVKEYLDRLAEENDKKR